MTEKARLLDPGRITEIREAAERMACDCTSPDFHRTGDPACMISRLLVLTQTLGTLQQERALYENAQCVTCKKHLDLAAEADALQQEREKATDYAQAALKDLVAAIERVHRDKQWQAIFVLNFVRGAPYTGPTYNMELQAKQALVLSEGEKEKG